MLTALVEAAGHELIVDVRPHASLRRGLPDTRLGRRLRRHRPAIVELLAAHGARHAQVFGSVARGDDGADSDIDLLVELDASVGLVGLAGLVRELGALLATDVDVVPIDSLKPGVREAVLAEAIPL